MTHVPCITSVRNRVAAKVFLFIDNSNIYISAKDEADKREGAGARHAIRIHFQHLLELAVARREVGGVFVVGSIPPEQRSIWDRLEQATGVKPELYERGGVTGGEQGLDQCLQVHMLRAMGDHSDNPQVIVLMTGDGAGYDDGVGFHADMERMHRAGWGIEVVSWRNHCRRALREWAVANGVFVSLDEYYDSVTFIERGRAARVVDLSQRELSAARPSPVKVAEDKARAEAAGKIAALERKLREMEQVSAEKAAAKARHDKKFQRGKK